MEIINPDLSTVKYIDKLTLPEILPNSLEIEDNKKKFNSLKKNQHQQIKIKISIKLN